MDDCSSKRGDLFDNNTELSTDVASRGNMNYDGNSVPRYRFERIGASHIFGIKLSPVLTGS